MLVHNAGAGIFYHVDAAWQCIMLQIHANYV